MAASAYAAWDLFDYGKFARQYRRIDFCRPDLAPFRLKDDIMVERVDTLAKSLEQADIKDSLLADLFNNAVRRYCEGKYDDALSRLYRFTEMLAQFVLKNDYGLRTSDVDCSKLAQALRQKWEQRSDQKTSKLQLGLVDAYALLDDLRHPLGREFKNNSRLKSYLSERNQSFLAHGFKPISEKTYVHLKDELEKLAAVQISNFPRLCQTLKFPWENLS